MRILHVSDLHVTPPATLPEAWAPVEAYLHPDDRFDFIVVSGDLSERADPKEFRALQALVAGDLLRRLSKNDRARIVFVPGNHDVLWDDAQFKPVLQGNDTAAAVQSVKKDPHRSDYRIQVTDVGTLQLWQINQDEYAKRLTSVQTFFDGFYGGSLAAKPCKPFALLTPGEDWSCHAFPEQGIAFVGLNSCHRNDKHWHGAGFDPRAIDAATKHVRELRRQQPNLLVVAVWHHGFSGDVARPDRLALRDVGRLYNLGARLGLHGHTHLADTQHHELLDGSLRILATGSLAAGRDGLPDLTPNQFSILDIDADATQVHVETLRLNYQQQYEVALSKAYTIAAASRSRREGTAQRSSCRRHRRVCKINADGVKHVAVEMQDLRPFGGVQLALIVPPFGSSSSRDPLLFANERQELLYKKLPGGKDRYAADLKSKRGRLAWQYDVSNAVALTEEELLLLPSRAETYPNIMPEEDACAFVPTFGCEQLELEAQFESAPAFQNARALVERRASHGSMSEWEVDNDETARVTNGFTHARVADHNVMTMTVERPLVDHRYSLVFTPGPEGRPYPSEAKFLAKDLLSVCRGEQFEASKLRRDLTLAVGDALNQQLGSDIGEWIAHLWDAEERVLLAAFGQFPSFAWGSYFEAGSGIAGHAFRHSSVVGWSDHVQGRTQAVYRKAVRVPGQGAREYQWVLCLPLRVSARGPAIGVIGFARTESKTPAEKRCEEYVRNLAEQPRGSSELMELVAAVTLAFWTALTASRAITENQRTYAKARLAEFQQGTTLSAPQP